MKGVQQAGCAMQMYMQGYVHDDSVMIAVLRALKLGVPGEAHMACWLFTTAASPSTELQEVFLKGLCSHAEVQMALTQLQHHHVLAAQNSQVYSALLPRLSPGQLMLGSICSNCA